MTASSLTAALLVAGNEGCLSVVHKKKRHSLGMSLVISQNLAMTALTRLGETQVINILLFDGILACLDGIYYSCYA